MGKKSIGIRHALLMGAAAFGFGAAATTVTSPAYAQETSRSYNIPAQNLDDALREFGRQTGRDVLFTPDAVANKHSPGVHGSMTEREALMNVLQGSGLRFEQTASGGYAVQDPNSPTRLGDASGAASSDDLADRSDGASAEIFVTGRRSLNTDIRRTEDDAQPYVVFGAQEIQNSGALTVDDFLRQRLPMNAPASANAGSALQTGRQGSNAATLSGRFNLRGLGTDQTLVLVDGRRLPDVRTDTIINSNQPNITGIPVSAIERIEVLPATASGQYGGQATGGVINIILKRDYSGLDLSATYGNTFDSDVGRTQFDATGGFSLEDGRTHIMATVSHAQQNSLTSNDRDFSRRAYEHVLQNAPTSSTLSNYLYGPTANIFAGVNLTLASDGTPLNSPFTFVPNGYAGPGSDNSAGLVANAGHHSVITGLERSLYAAPTIDSASISIRREMTPNIDAFLDLYTDRAESGFDQQASNQGIAFGGSAVNPFQQFITFNVIYPGVFDHSTTETESSRARAGVIARLPFHWSGSLDYGWAQSVNSYETRQSFLKNASTALNFLDMSALPPGVLAANMFQNLTEGHNITNTLQSWDLRLSGPLFALPGGNLTFTGLLEQIEDDSDGAIQHNVNETSNTYAWLAPSSEQTRSAYGELRAPIFGASNNIPFVRELELSAAVRWDQYDIHYSQALNNNNGGLTIIPGPDGPFPSVTHTTNEFDSTDYTLSLRYSPLEDITFRASYGTGFKPPPLTAIRPGFTQIRFPPTFLTDPRRGGAPVTGDPNSSPPNQLLQLNGGNPNLQPETSDSFSYGIIFTPHFIEGLRFSIDVSDTHKDNEIPPFVSGQYLIDHEADFPGRIVRGPNLPGDPSGFAGPIISLDATSVNALHTDLRTVDFQVDYNRDTDHWGDWHFYLVATHFDHFVRQQSLGDTPLSNVGFVDGPLEWQGNLGIDWNAGPWTVGWNTQYYDSYSICFTTFCIASQLAAQGSRTIPAQIYHDAYVTYRFDHSNIHILDGTEIAFGIQNLFDTEPPVDVTTLGTGYSAYGDPRLRRFTLTLRKHFG